LLEPIPKTMKKIILLILVSLLAMNVSWSQCHDYYDFEEGSYWRFSSYNAKGKLMGQSSQTVLKHEATSTGYQAIIQVVSIDKKGNKGEPIELDWECKDGVMLFDMKKFLPEEQLAGMEDLEIAVTGEHLELPSGLTIGDELPDASVVMDMSTGGMGMKITVNITNRLVEKKESITTEAGTFDCVKISSTITTKTIMSMEMQSVEWVAPGVGMVKSETYRKGNMVGYTVLDAKSD